MLQQTKRWPLTLALLQDLEKKQLALLQGQTALCLQEHVFYHHEHLVASKALHDGGQHEIAGAQLSGRPRVGWGRGGNGGGDLNWI